MGLLLELGRIAAASAVRAVGHRLIGAADRIEGDEEVDDQHFVEAEDGPLVTDAASAYLAPPRTAAAPETPAPVPGGSLADRGSSVGQQWVAGR